MYASKRVERNFVADYLTEIVRSLPNQFDDNYDHHRFGRSHKKKEVSFLKAIVRDQLYKRGWGQTNLWSHQINHALRMVQPFIPKFDELYRDLGDEESRCLLIKVLAYRALGLRKVKLPLNTPEYWKGIRRVEGLADCSRTLNANFMDWELSKVDFSSQGIPLNLYGLPKGLYSQIIMNPYLCRASGSIICAKPGDVVIDGGGCWGETALNFAYLVGQMGRVYSYEFIPNNLSIFKENLNLNADLSSRVHVVENALWSESGIRFFYKDMGPASQVEPEEFEGSDGSVESLNIDNLVQQRNLEKVDLIKMDIEGAELKALWGATQTMREFKPKLAISIYHKFEHLTEIPLFIKELDLGYRLFIRHFSIHSEETVLFCRVA